MKNKVLEIEEHLKRINFASEIDDVKLESLRMILEMLKGLHESDV